MATMKCRAKLSTTWSDMASEKPSSSSAVTSGLRPGSAPLIDTVRIMAPNTSQGGVSSSLVPCGQARRPPPTRPRLTEIASGQSMAIAVSGCAWAVSASASAAMPA